MSLKNNILRPVLRGRLNGINFPLWLCTCFYLFITRSTNSSGYYHGVSFNITSSWRFRPYNMAVLLRAPLPCLLSKQALPLTAVVRATACLSRNGRYVAVSDADSDQNDGYPMPIPTSSPSIIPSTSTLGKPIRTDLNIMTDLSGFCDHATTPSGEYDYRQVSPIFDQRLMVLFSNSSSFRNLSKPIDSVFGKGTWASDLVKVSICGTVHQGPH